MTPRVKISRKKMSRPFIVAPVTGFKTIDRPYADVYFTFFKKSKSQEELRNGPRYLFGKIDKW
jgi:hypothetical protein